MQFNGATQVYGIMGRPVAHSLSPAMHNAAFQKLGLNKVYVPFAVDNVARAMDGFRALGIRGVSVTIPHKQAVIEYLDAIDPVAERIGAVNTLVIDQGSIQGLNTDWIGANRALAQAMTIKDKKVLILGAGGSARAIGFGLLEEGAAIALASRTPAKGQALAAQLQCQWHPLDAVQDLRADALINATSVGMAPLADASPVPPVALRNFPVVMDIVYAPLETRLLAEAKAAGCAVVDGLAMLLYQGVAQFEIWTGRKAPVTLMRNSLLRCLTQKEQ